LYADLDRHAQQGALDRFRSSWEGASRCSTRALTRCCAGTSSTTSFRRRHASSPESWCGCCGRETR